MSGKVSIPNLPENHLIYPKFFLPQFTDIFSIYYKEADTLFEKRQAEPKRIIEETLAVKTPGRMIARIISIKKSTAKQMIITLNNGQVWRQIDHSPLPLRNGDDIIIRSAQLGSYLLQKHSGSGSIRVKRMI